MKVTGLLMEEHRHILRALDVMERMAARTAEGEQVDQNDLESVLSFLRFFADDHHQSKEESLLFPALLKASKDEEHACLCKMTFEHNQQRSLVEGIEDSLRTRKGSDFVYYAQRLSDIMRDHIQEEDNVLFKHADSLLTPEEDERIARQIGNFDSPGRKRALILVLQRLMLLELKYNAAVSVRETAMHA